jgi:hypothetical protein
LKSLEEVLASPDRPDLLVSVSDPEAIRTRVKYHDGKVWLIASNTRQQPVKVKFSWKTSFATATVIGEERTLTLEDSSLTDDFGAYEAHVYRLQ